MVPLKDWRKRGWGTGREGDKKQEFGFSGFGHVKCEISTLLTHGKKKQQEKCWTCKWHSKEKSELEMDIQESMATGWQIKLWNEWAHLMRKSRESRVSGLGCESNQHFKGYFVRQTKT